jgi:hypothetical protein
MLGVAGFGSASGRSVCRAWRAAVLETPEVWRKLDMSYGWCRPTDSTLCMHINADAWAKVCYIPQQPVMPTFAGPSPTNDVQTTAPHILTSVPSHSSPLLTPNVWCGLLG